MIIGMPYSSFGGSFPGGYHNVQNMDRIMWIAPEGS
jgi:hypothetical protein